MTNNDDLVEMIFNMNETIADLCRRVEALEKAARLHQTWPSKPQQQLPTQEEQPMTARQASLIEDFCHDNNYPLPIGFQKMDKEDASEWIAANIPFDYIRNRAQSKYRR